MEFVKDSDYIAMRNLKQILATNEKVAKEIREGTVQSDCPPPAKTPNAPRPQPSKTGATRETVRTPPTATVVHRVAGAPRSEIRCPIRGTAPHRKQPF